MAENWPARLRRRSGEGVRGGWQRVRAGAALASQAGVAAGLAWFVAHDLFGSANPFFAPIAAVITLAVSVGQRLRRTAELVIGVAIGILVGDAIILLIGSGPWQIGLIVFLAIVTATAVGGGSALVVQSASSSVLVATVTASTGGLPYSRFFDALIGGLVGLTVMAIVLPLNPLTVIRRAADPALDVLADGLHEVSEALAERDVDRIEAAFVRLRAGEGEFGAFAAAVTAAGENSALAPARLRLRGALARYADGAVHLTYALRNVRVMVRRLLTALSDDEPIPEALPSALGLLGEAVRLLKQELSDDREPIAARERALQATVHTGRAYDDGVGFSGGVVVAQLRTSVADLLCATGIEHAEARRLVRRAVGWHARPRTNRRAGRTRPGLTGRS